MFSAIKLYWLLSTIPLVFAQVTINLTDLPVIELPSIEDLLPGIKAEVEDYPFLVHLSVEVTMSDQIEFMDIFKFLMCVGSLVSPMWVMSSACCLNTNFLFPTLEPQIVSNDKVHCRVRVKKATPIEIATEAAITAAEVLVHPEYAVENFRSVHNFGLIRLQKAFDLIPKTAFVDIPDNTIDFNDDVTIVGYNNFLWTQMFMANKTDDLAKVDTSLQKLSSKVWTRETCQEKAHNPAAICIGQKGNLPWILDFGGPLIHNNKVVGIALGSDAPTEYGVYEDVYSHRAWIASKVQIDGNATKDEDSASGVQCHNDISIIYFDLVIIYLLLVKFRYL